MDYKKFFKPETLAKLNKQSAESLKQLLGNKTFMKAAIESPKLLAEIEKAEAPYKTKLEQLAVDLVTELYPIIEQENMIIDAHLGNIDQVTQNLQGNDGKDQEELMQDISSDSRRRIINAITQGAAVRGAFAFHLFNEVLDKIDSSLVEKYNQIMKNTFGIYDDENAIALMLAMLAQGQKAAGGSSEVEFDEEEDEPFIIIHASAINFPMLVHEIVKGLFELVSLQGFREDKEKNKQTVARVDKLSNEPEDLRYGKFIYDHLRNIGQQYGADNKIIPYFFAEVYQMEDEPFMDFIENIINDRLTNQQKQWVKNTISDIKDDISRDNMEIDEIKIKDPNIKIKIHSDEDGGYYYLWEDNPLIDIISDDEKEDDYQAGYLKKNPDGTFNIDLMVMNKPYYINLLQKKGIYIDNHNNINPEYLKIVDNINEIRVSSVN